MTSTATPAEPAALTFDVIVRTQGNRPSALVEAMASLGSQQTEAEFSVIVAVHAPVSVAEAAQSQLRAGAGMPKKWRVLAVGAEGGRCRPLNAALEFATADYVTFLDDDDLAYPNWLEVFAQGAVEAPGAVVRSVVHQQNWTASATGEPQSPIGPLTTPFADRFDLLAHLSHNETPICSMALPRQALSDLNITFDESLDLLEDWDLLLRTAQRIPVHSRPQVTSLYRRVNTAGASSQATPGQWEHCREQILHKLSAGRVMVPGGDVYRLAEARFTPGGPPVTALVGEDLPRQWLTDGFRHHHSIARTQTKAALCPKLSPGRSLARRLIPTAARARMVRLLPRLARREGSPQFAPPTAATAVADSTESDDRGER